MTDSPYDKHYFEALKIMNQEDSAWAELYLLEQDKKEQAMSNETFTSEIEALEAIDQEATDHAIKWLKQHKPQALKAIKYLAEAGWSSDRIVGRIEAKYKDSEPNIQHKMKLVAEWAVRNRGD